jgi:hypothetical protein
MELSFPESWSRERSGARDCLVSVLYGRHTSGNGSSLRPLFQRTTAACRTSQAVVSARSITSPGQGPAGQFPTNTGACAPEPLEWRTR